MDHQNTVPLGNQSTGFNTTNSIDPVVGDIAGSVIGNVATSIANRNAQKRAFQYNTQMWHAQNRYNHPAQQMIRLKKAGLNPAMMYKGMPHNVSGNPPQYKAPTHDFRMNPNIVGSLATMQQIKNNQVNARLAEAQIRLTSAKEMLTILDRMHTVTKDKRAQIENRLLDAFGAPERLMGLAKQQNEIDRNNAQIDILKIQRMVQRKEWEQFRDYNIRPNDTYGFIIKNIMDYIRSGDAQKHGNKAVDTIMDYTNKALEQLESEKDWNRKQIQDAKTGEVWIKRADGSYMYIGKVKR